MRVTVPLDDVAEFYKRRAEIPWAEMFAKGVQPPAVTIVALDVPADATAEHLREIAERFEVRDAVLRDASLWANLEPGEIEACAADLHRAGWRPGMTAEDAARMLADQANHARKSADIEQRLIDAGCDLCFDQDDP